MVVCFRSLSGQKPPENEAFLRPYGVNFTAEAPVSVELEERLAAFMATKAPVNRKLVRSLLALYNNNYDEAGARPSSGVVFAPRISSTDCVWCHTQSTTWLLSSEPRTLLSLRYTAFPIQCCQLLCADISLEATTCCHFHPQLPTAWAGVFRESSGMYELNVQTGEVYSDGRMFMPVPATIASHNTFKELFASKAPNLCMLAATTKNTQQIQVEVMTGSADTGSETMSGVAYDITRWEQLPYEVFGSGENAARAADYTAFVRSTVYPSALAASAPTSGSFLPALSDGCHGCPVATADGVIYLNQTFSVRYECGKHGWLSEVLDREAGIANSVIWLSTQLAATTDDAAGSGHGCALGMLYFHGNDAVRPCWVEIAAWPAQRVLTLFYLAPIGRRMQRIPVFCSNYQRDIAGLPPLLMEKSEPLPESCRNFSMFTLNAAAGVFDKETVVITRTRWVPRDTDAADDGGDPEAVGATAVVESYIDRVFMTAVLPECVVSRYEWWRDDSQEFGGVIRGFPLRPQDSTAIEVVLLKDGELQPQVWRHNVTAVGKDSATQRETLLFLDLAHAHPGSALGHLASWAMGLDNLSHVVAWSSSAADVGDECTVAVLEFPRLNLSFRTRAVGTASVLFCENHPNLHVPAVVPPDIVRLSNTLPHSVVLEDDAMQYHLVVGNQSMHACNIVGQPFSVLLHRCTTEIWEATTKSKYFLFPVHTSQTFFTSPSLSASLFVACLNLLMRRYIEACRVIEGCFTDRTLSQEESYILYDLLESTKADKHPDAHACRLKLMSLLLDGWKTLEPPSEDVLAMHPRGHMEMRLPGQFKAKQVSVDDLTPEQLFQVAKVEENVGSYLDKLAHVSPECVLSAQEELVLLQALALRSGNRGLSVKLQNRLAYQARAVGETERSTPDAADVGIAPVVFATRTLESQHPYGAMNWYLKFVFPGATWIKASFDESSEVRCEDDYVVFYTDDSCTATHGEAKYTGGVFRGNWCGSRPNPFKPARPVLVISGDSVVVHARSNECMNGDWGWKLFLTANVAAGSAVNVTPIMGPSSSAAVVDRAADEQAPSAAAPAAQCADGVVLRQPKLFDGSAIAQYFEGMCQKGLALYDLKKAPWARTVNYQRPPHASTTGAEVLSLIEASWRDTMQGEERKLGWLFLYEVLSGIVSVKALPESRSVRIQFSESFAWCSRL